MNNLNGFVEVPLPHGTNLKAMNAKELDDTLTVAHKNVLAIDAAIGHPPRPGTDAKVSDGWHGIQSGANHEIMTRFHAIPGNEHKTAPTLQDNLKRLGL